MGKTSEEKSVVCNKKVLKISIFLMNILQKAIFKKQIQKISGNRIKIKDW